MAFFDAGGKRAIWIVHRRGGKDLTALHQTCKEMHKRKGQYWHVFPTAEQARKAIWDGFTKDGQRIMEQVFPAAIRKTPRAFLPNAEMVVELKCGSIWRLMGSDKMEVVGAGPVGVTFSEFALAKPKTWDLVRPMLRENDGWASFVTTPRGKNHAHKLWKMAQDNPDWFCERLTLRDTNAYDPDKTIAEERAEGMPEALIQQEYMCDFDAALVGSVWGDLLSELERRGGVGPYTHESDRVFTTWDLGLSDSTAIWFWRPVSNGVEVLDYYEANGKPLSHFFDEVEAKPYTYAKHWLPHDAKAKTLATGSSILDRFLERYGSGAVSVVPGLSIPDGIQAGRWLLQQPGTRFHERCAEGLDALRAYHYGYNEDTKAFSRQPVHDWSSHCFTADTLVQTRYGACRIDALPRVGEVMTPCGWMPYRSPRVTARNARLVRVLFGDGSSVRCTPGHLFLTDSGWKSAESLTRSSRILSSLTQSRSTLTEGFTASGQARSTLREAARSSIARCGKGLLARFRAAATYTTRTATRLTTELKTLSAWMRARISVRHGRSLVEARRSTSMMPRERGLLRGIVPRPDGYGTVDTPKDRRHGPSGSGSPSNANTAWRHSTQSSERTAETRFGAPKNARWLHIESVEHLSETEDVWDITVPGVECFALANGATVHNCADSWRYLSIVAKVSERLTRPAPRVEDKPAARSLDSFTLDELYALNEGPSGRKRI